jgi:hypothetical protein
MLALTQADAKKGFVTKCREAIVTGERVYVADKTGRRFLTLDPKQRNLAGLPAIAIPAQYFKENFSRCCSLAKSGLIFRLSLSGTDLTIFARRHTKYFDPGDALIKRWGQLVTTDSIAKHAQETLLELIGNSKANRDTVRDLIQIIVRLMIGILLVEEEPGSGDT